MASVEGEEIRGASVCSELEDKDWERARECEEDEDEEEEARVLEEEARVWEEEDFLTDIHACDGETTRLCELGDTCI